MEDALLVARMIESSMQRRRSSVIGIDRPFFQLIKEVLVPAFPLLILHLCFVASLTNSRRFSTSFELFTFEIVSVPLIPVVELEGVVDPECFAGPYTLSRRSIGQRGPEHEGLCIGTTKK